MWTLFSREKNVTSQDKWEAQTRTPLGLTFKLFIVGQKCPHTFWRLLGDFFLNRLEELFGEEDGLAHFHELPEAKAR